MHVYMYIHLYIYTYVYICIHMYIKPETDCVYVFIRISRLIDI